LSYATLTGANLTGAEVRGVSFHRDSYVGDDSGLSAAQLYSTASYQARDLTGIGLSGDFAGLNLANQNLANANFRGSLSGANLRQANLANASFVGPYSISDLTGADLSQANLTNAFFAGYYDEYETFYPGSNLAGANLAGADARGASFQNATMTGAITSNLIQSHGHIAGLDLTAGKSLGVRDYDGNPAALPTPTGPLPIVVDQQLAMDASGSLRLEFDADPWDSTISFAPGISVIRDGTLELSFAADVVLSSQLGRTIDLFDWTGVTPTGVFNVVSPYGWDVSKLYTTGEVTFTSAAGVMWGDLNGDGAVNATDVADWKVDFGINSGSDADGDGDTDGSDFLAWQRRLGSSSASRGSSVGVPEPAAVVPTCMALLGAALGRLARRSGCTG
jgi:uncharacterized protein YjbI with pentapeptide repeats